MITIFIFVILSFFAGSMVHGNEKNRNRTDLKCFGRPFYNVSLTAYYPDFDNDVESDYLDSRGKKLRTLQDYLDGRCEYVTVSLDSAAKLPYGTRLCVPELNEHFGRQIELQVRDDDVNLRGKGLSRLDICVRGEVDSYDNSVNRIVTVFI